MIKYVAISLIAIFLMACTGNKNSYFSEEEKEDSNAKEMLQGIWLDDETESPLMRVEGDTIFYADSQSAPIAFILMGMIRLIIRLISRQNIYSGFIP